MTTLKNPYYKRTYHSLIWRVQSRLCGYHPLFEKKNKGTAKGTKVSPCCASTQSLFIFYPIAF